MSLLDFNPPVITGETNITEGDTLDLYCNATTSNPLPSVQWLNSDGKLISDHNRVHTTNTSSDKAGTYTCLATQSNATMNSTVTVNIHVNCEYTVTIHVHLHVIVCLST